MFGAAEKPRLRMQCNGGVAGTACGASLFSVMKHTVSPEATMELDRSREMAVH